MAKNTISSAAPDDKAKCDFLHSSRREKLIEHLFVGKIMRYLWLHSVYEADVLRAETDAAGYDIVIEVGSIARQIQLKSSSRYAKTSRQKINLALAQKGSGCVIWVTFDPSTMKLGPFLWFGGAPGERLPDMSDEVRFPIAKHTKGDAMGIKAERKKIRVTKHHDFEELKSVGKVIEKLFGLKSRSQGTRDGTP